MARLTAAVPSWTPTQLADTTGATDNGHHTVQGGSATQRCELREAYLGGQAGASSPTFMVLGRTSIVGTSAFTQSRLAAQDPSTAAYAAPPIPYVASNVKPQRSATLGILLNLSFNAFGGVVRWVNGPDELISLLGNTQPLGELMLSCYTGGTPGLLGSHIIFEVI